MCRGIQLWSGNSSYQYVNIHHPQSDNLLYLINVNGCHARQAAKIFDQISEYILLIVSSPVAKAWPYIRPIPTPHYCLMRAETSLQGSGSALIAAVWWRRGLLESAVTHGALSPALTTHSFSQNNLTPLIAAPPLSTNSCNAEKTKCINNHIYLSVRRHKWCSRQIRFDCVAYFLLWNKRHAQNFSHTSVVCYITVLLDHSSCVYMNPNILLNSPIRIKNASCNHFNLKTLTQSGLIRRNFQSY